VVLLAGEVLLWAQLQSGGLHRAGAGWVAAPDYQLTAREGGYVRTCRWLAPRLGPRAVIAAPEIGAVGYFCGARILDTVGLVTPGMDGYNARNPRGGVPLALVMDRRPDYVVGLGVFVRDTLLPDAAFRRAYRQVVLFDDPAWDSRGVYVFARRAIGAQCS
jgi:hypothetical protein